ncbi:hypothetical protein [Arcticibacter sp. MXS-1]|uniref:hypothetical protein n=1 Tax=Arcticibacter sp. MXS-1 TaxID=3341726 RepID=UPI0035A9562D
MNKLLLFGLIYISVSFASPAKGQHGPRHIEALKIEFITQKLDLSSEEAEKFWPVYNNYQRELNTLFRERRQARLQQRETGTPPDELKFESRMLDIKKRYKKEFQEVLPPQKADMLYPVEREFRERLINQLRERGRGR